MGQDPEMMAEAKKMMDDPAFKKQMKQMSESKSFKDAVKQTTDMSKDPTKAAQAEAKLEHMVKVGEENLKKGAMGAMEEAMAAMSNPEVLDQMGKMMKDPQFLAQI